MKKLYRATNDKKYTGQWSCWTPDRKCAEAYRDNPGFGGENIISAEATGKIMWLDESNPYKELAEYLGIADWQELRGYADFVYQVWENSPEVREQIIALGYSWIVYEDDYPQGCMTWVYLGETPLEYKEEE